MFFDSIVYKTAYIYTLIKCVYISTCAICDMWEAVIVVGMATVWDSEPLLLFCWTSSIATANEHSDIGQYLDVDVMLSMASTHIKGFHDFWISNAASEIKYFPTIYSM